MANCILKIGSFTNASKAKQVLAGYSISANIMKSSENSKKGCLHGIEFDCANKNNIKSILSRAQIPFEER